MLGPGPLAMILTDLCHGGATERSRGELSARATGCDFLQESKQFYPTIFPTVLIHILVLVFAHLGSHNLHHG